VYRLHPLLSPIARRQFQQFYYILDDFPMGPGKWIMMYFTGHRFVGSKKKKIAHAWNR
jgi:hypothetical protein